MPGADALTAGTDFASLFFTMDYRTLDDYSDRVEAGSTGSFRSDFAAKRGELRRLLSEQRSTSQGRVLVAAVRDVEPTSATVLVAADQDVHSTATGGKPVSNRYRVAERLRLIDGRWLVEDLEPIVGTFENGCPDTSAGADRAELLRQSCSDIERLYSYDYRSIDADVATQLSTTTGSLHEQIVTTTGATLRRLAPKEQVTVAGKVDTAAVEHFSGDTATVLVFLDQAVTNRQLPAPRLDRNRLEVTMQRVEGRWLVADVKAL